MKVHRVNTLAQWIQSKSGDPVGRIEELESPGSGDALHLVDSIDSADSLDPVVVLNAQPNEGTVVPETGAARWLGRRWIKLLAGLLLIGGVVGSGFTSASVGRHDEDQSRQALARSAAEIASTLRLAIQREEDLAVIATAFFIRTPGATNTEFVTWASSIKALERYPELLGWGEVVMVTSSQLDAFKIQAAADPAGVVATGVPFSLYPPGDRPFYCLFLVGQSRTGLNGAPAGFDYCAPPTGDSTLAARDSGLNGYQAVDAGAGPTLAVRVPFYRGGVTPTTVDGRQEAFLGWVGLGFDPKVLLGTAMEARTGTAVVMRFHDAGSDAEFTSGQAPNGAGSVTIDLHDGWTVQTLSAVSKSGVFSNGGALLVLLGGAGASLALAALVLVLGTGRSRALWLVRKRTGELRHQAFHDSLTGLPNRELIADRINQLLARTRRYGRTSAALYIDLDDFKNVNDTLGHEAGDRLLVAVTTRLMTTLREADTIGRMGGDEFVVLIDCASDNVPELVAQRLLDVMRQPFELAGAPTPIVVNTSIGIAMGDRLKGGDLLRDADVALYQAKLAGKNRYAMFVPAMQTEISRRIELEFDLRSAMDGHQLRLVYQPIFNLEDLALVGVEALLRWNDPRFGVVGPDEFVPMLEQSGQIREVGRWVLQQGCAQMAKWHAMGDRLDVSINVSGRQLDHDEVVDDVREALASSGLDPRSLIVEVTETALMRNATATAVRLHAIRDLGVRIAVDDFGTGYSSLAYLQQFPVDSLKIDRRFTNAITTSPESKALIRTFVQLGRDLGLKTLAEGVETMDEMDHLRQEHVDFAQGFLLSRPLEADAMETHLLRPSHPAPIISPQV